MRNEVYKQNIYLDMLIAELCGSRKAFCSVII